MITEKSRHRAKDLRSENVWITVVREEQIGSARTAALIALVLGLLRFGRYVTEALPVIAVCLQTRRLPSRCCNQALGHRATGACQLSDTLGLAA